MCTRCLLVFFAGAAAFHAFSHFMLIFTGLLPITVWGITLTPMLNYVAIGSSLLLCGLLLWLAKDRKCSCKPS
jgi:hypothetical protein